MEFGTNKSWSPKDDLYNFGDPLTWPEHSSIMVSMSTGNTSEAERLPFSNHICNIV